MYLIAVPKFLTEKLLFNYSLCSPIMLQLIVLNRSSYLNKEAHELSVYLYFYQF